VGDVAGAQRVLQAASAGGGEQAVAASYRLALLLRGQGEVTQAATLLEQVVTTGGSWAAAASIALASLRWRHGDPAAAIALLQDPAVRHSPYAARAALTLGTILAAEGEHDNAVTAWRQALHSPDPTISTTAALNLAGRTADRRDAQRASPETTGSHGRGGPVVSATDSLNILVREHHQELT
jgi:predicted negative regulator of RcsB-dependent stress response